MPDFLFLITAYFLGAIPFAYLFARLFSGQDIRSVGSGNVGAMNTARYIGVLPGILTVLADISKGALAVFLAANYGTAPLLPLCAALLVIIGHNFNLFLGFKGGKGLACLVGALFVVSLWTSIYLLAFVVVLSLLLRDINTAAGISMLSLPFLLGLGKTEPYIYLIGSAIALVIIFKHIPDFKAYRQGRRKMLGFKNS